MIENDTSFNLMHHLESGDEYILSSLQLVFSMVEARDNNMKILIVIFWFIEDFNYPQNSTCMDRQLHELQFDLSLKV